MRTWPYGGGDHQHHAALVDAGDRVDGDSVRQRVHQRRGLPDPDLARRTRSRPRQGRPAVVDAELRNGSHPHRVGLRRRPDRRTHRVGGRVGADGGRGLRSRIGALAFRGRRVPAARRNGRGQQQHRQRQACGRLVPTATARAGHGHSADGPAPGSRVGRVGDSAAGRELRRIRGAAVPRRGMRGGRRRVRGRGEGSPTACRAPRPPNTTSPTRTADRPLCGVSTPSRYFWSRRRSWCGRSRWCG